MFVVYVAADLYNNKVNLEIDFPFDGPPSLHELRSKIEAVFSGECIVLRHPAQPLQQFGILKLQSYDDATGAWRDLSSATQLAPYAQLYVFQSDPNYHESQEQIMPARKPTKPFVSGGGGRVASPPRGARDDRSPLRASGDRLAAAGGHTATNAPAASASSPVPRGRSGAGTAIATVQTPQKYSGSAVGAGGSSLPRHQNHSPTASAAAPAFMARGGGAAANQAPATKLNTTSRVPHDNASLNEKVMFVFEEMDRNQNRVVQNDEFRGILRDLNIDFSAAVVGELYRKADADRDGVLTASELTSFFHLYPTLLDSIFFRLKDIYDGRELQEELVMDTQRLSDARAQRSRASVSTSEISKLLQEQQSRVVELDADRQRRGTREREIKERLGQGDSDLDRAQRDFAERDRELRSCLDREEHSRIHAQEARRAADDTDVSHRQLVEALNQSEGRVRELQRMLAEAEGEAERHRRLVTDIQQEVLESRERESKLTARLGELEESTCRAREGASLAEREVALRTERQQEVAAILAEEQAESNHLAQRLNDEQHELDSLREKERSHRSQEHELDAALQSQERRVAQKEQEMAQFTQRRADMEQKERPLLEQELRLRDQRDKLEENEMRHRRDAGSLFEPTIRHTTAGSATGTTPGRGMTSQLASSPLPTSLSYSGSRVDGGGAAAASSYAGSSPAAFVPKQPKDLSPPRR